MATNAPTSEYADQKREADARRKVADSEQRIGNKRTALDRLLDRRRAVLAAGGSAAEFPLPSSQMGTKDLEAYITRLEARAATLPKLRKPVAQPAPAAPQPSRVGDEMEKVLGLPATAAPRTPEVSRAGDAMEQLAQRNPGGIGPMPQGSVAAGAASRPALAPESQPDAMDAIVKRIPFATGRTLPANQTVKTDGSGSYVEGTTSGGAPNRVHFQPTMEQAMEERTGGQWSRMKPEERAAWLRDPKNRIAQQAPVGEVTGRTAFNASGDTMMIGPGQTKGPLTGGYDPRMDRRGTTAVGPDGSKEILNRTKMAPGDFARSTQRPQSEDWQKKIVEKYPDIGVAGTPANKAFLESFAKHGAWERAMADADAVGKQLGLKPGQAPDAMEQLAQAPTPAPAAPSATPAAAPISAPAPRAAGITMPSLPNLPNTYEQGVAAREKLKDATIRPIDEALTTTGDAMSRLPGEIDRSIAGPLSAARGFVGLPPAAAPTPMADALSGIDKGLMSAGKALSNLPGIRDLGRPDNGLRTPNVAPPLPPTPMPIPPSSTALPGQRITSNGVSVTMPGTRPETPDALESIASFTANPQQDEFKKRKNAAPYLNDGQ